MYKYLKIILNIYLTYTNVNIYKYVKIILNIYNYLTI